MSTTPYQSPAAGRTTQPLTKSAKGPVVTGPFHSERSVGLASFLGGPIAGGVLLAANFRRRGKSQDGNQAVRAVVLSTVASVLLITAQSLVGLPTPFSTLIHVGVLLAYQKITMSSFSGDAVKHVKRGEETPSVWIGVVVGLVAFAVQAAAIIAIASNA